MFLFNLKKKYIYCLICWSPFVKYRFTHILQICFYSKDCVILITIFKRKGQITTDPFPVSSLSAYFLWCLCQPTYFQLRSFFFYSFSSHCLQQAAFVWSLFAYSFIFAHIPNHLPVRLFISDLLLCFIYSTVGICDGDFSTTQNSLKFLKFWY